MATKVKEKVQMKETKQQKAAPKLEKKEDAKTWYLVDAKDKGIGRLAARIASLLIGKHKVNWLPYLDSGDYVIVINASKVSISGRKEADKKYYRYSGYPSGLKVETFADLKKRKPEDLIYHAVKGMLPKTKLGRAMIKKLFVYPGEKHQHEAQKPKVLEIRI